jgi:hypothetical protein
MTKLLQLAYVHSLSGAKLEHFHRACHDMQIQRLMAPDPTGALLLRITQQE